MVKKVTENEPIFAALVVIFERPGDALRPSNQGEIVACFDSNAAHPPAQMLRIVSASLNDMSERYSSDFDELAPRSDRIH